MALLCLTGSKKMNGGAALQPGLLGSVKEFPKPDKYLCFFPSSSLKPLATSPKIFIFTKKDVSLWRKRDWLVRYSLSWLIWFFQFLFT